MASCKGAMNGEDKEEGEEGPEGSTARPTGSCTEDGDESPYPLVGEEGRGVVALDGVSLDVLEKREANAPTRLRVFEAVIVWEWPGGREATAEASDCDVREEGE